MKKIILLTVLALWSLTNYAQAYHNFTEPNSLWHGIVTGSTSGPDWFYMDSLTDQVTLSGTDYYEVHHYSHHPGTFDTYYLREDAAAKKVYLSDGTTEKLFYDFSITEGDTVHFPFSFTQPVSTPYYAVVMNMDSIVINSSFRRRWHLNMHVNNNFTKTDTWIEGIGSVKDYGLFNSDKPDVPLDNSTAYLGCFANEDYQYIIHTVCASFCPCINWLVSIDDLKAASIVTVHPNPTSDYINIEIESLFEEDYQITIVNALGETVYQEATQLKDIQIDCSPFSSGVYIVNIENDVKRWSHKVIIQ